MNSHIILEKNKSVVGAESNRNERKKEPTRKNDRPTKSRVTCGGTVILKCVLSVSKKSIYGYIMKEQVIREKRKATLQKR